MRTPRSLVVILEGVMGLLAGAAAASERLPVIRHFVDTIRGASDTLQPRYEALDAYVAAQRWPKAS